LDDKAQKLADKVFVYYKDKTLTYGELSTTSNRFANTLIHEAGVRKGDKVGVMFPNGPDYVLLAFSIAKTGAVQVPINTELKQDSLSYQINFSDIEVLIVDDKFFPLLQSISDRLKNVRKVFVKAAEFDRSKYSLGNGINLFPYENLFEGLEKSPGVDVHWYDPVAIFFTSGTTGLPKGVVLPHHHHYDMPRTLCECWRIGPEDIVYIWSPFYHGIAQYSSVGPALLAGGAIGISDRFSASRFWSEIRMYRATAILAVYTMAPILLKQPEKEDDADNPLRVYCTIGIAPSIVDTFEKRYGVKVLEIFGSTEQGVVAYTPYDKKKFGAVGPINTRDFEVKIVDENDVELPPGRVGEYVSRAKQPFVRMIEYYKMPDETLKYFRNLWMHSGDLARMDEEGWIYFEGRAKDSIRRRGENISAFDFETIAGSYEGVQECAAIPISSEFGEDEIKVVIVPKADQPFDIQAFIKFCEEKMPKYMVPRYVEVTEGLPKTGTGKVEKVKLKEQGLTKNTWDREIGDYVKK
jgi:crotonobetaine/carnitine-CoA ligase